MQLVRTGGGSAARDPQIVCVINFEPADVNRVVDCHIVWEVLFNGIPVYSENFVWANVTMYQFVSGTIDIGVCD